MLNYCEIGKRIRKYRKACHLSQEDLAARVDISTTHMSHIETGNTKLSLQVLAALAQEMAVSTDELLFGRPCGTEDFPENDLIRMLRHCSPGQIEVIREIAAAAKSAMDRHLQDA